MRAVKKDIFILCSLTTIAVFVFFIYLKTIPAGLYFVDSGRYADIASNLALHSIYEGRFTFPTVAVPNNFGWTINLPPLHSFLISLFFKVFLVDDKAVIFESGFFFIAGLPLVFLLARKIFSLNVALFSSFAYIFTPQLLNYAKDGASEPIFIFELLLIAYLLVYGKNWSSFLGGIILGLSLFTKLQAYLFAPLFVLWSVLLYSSELKKTFLFIIGPILLSLLNKWQLLFPFYHVGFSSYLIFQQTQIFPADNLPRSIASVEVDTNFIQNNLKVILTKIFYNLYNFYKMFLNLEKSLPDLAPSLIVINYILSNLLFFVKEIEKKRIFRIIVLLMLLGSVFLASATSPHVRYVHPLIPFLLILSFDFLDTLISRIKLPSPRLFLSLIIFLFLIMPLMGKAILDIRFTKKLYNIDKPYAHQLVGETLGKMTDENAVVVTNLDTWGSWYGQRKTMLIPLDFEDLSLINKKVKISAIYLTDFQKDNEDHPLKGDWEIMFENPNQISSQYILNNFYLVKTATISAQSNYENQEFRVQLWQTKSK